ncbi:VOC family protein [Mucilaginibacter ginsenosidivorax]|uniref:VOC domain-containing protein n=1 Tax=Mucilaginibacter ginsenosidivorax TaxID=862126 RepID=A0A5B8VWB5_9SPHI|nr:VOC family protein [Mucilaginibacter ginsenosidivorax]QEC75820.1 hypothetical protein FSB76_07590 [Mucilaginibacter ginsenosidivorax]
MKQVLSAVTIAAKNLQQLRLFYTGVLDWEILTENESVLMLKLKTVVLTLCTEAVFAGYTGIPPRGEKHTGCYFTINLDSAKEVDDNFMALASLKTTIVKMPAQTFWGGYSGFFTDPEDNLWELCHNPIPGTRA